MSTPSSPFQDHASPILQGDPSLSDQQRSDLWDAFHSKNSDELVQHLAPLVIPDETKHKLFVAKQAAAPVAPPVDKVTEAVQKMANLDPKTMDLVEAHPNLLKAFTTAATTEPKPAQEPSGATSAAPKPATAGKTAKPAAAPLAPRADGQPHFPPIPDGHKRILASDGGVHDLPEERLADAQKIDPNLHILNP
jgi:hypothetical protein